MKKHLPRIVVLVMAFTIVLGYIAFRRMHQGRQFVSLTENQRKEEMTKRVAFWLDQPSVPMLSPRLNDTINALMKRNNCIQEPAGTKKLSLSELNNSAKADLSVAVVGLLQAYANGDPDSMFDYMMGRKEQLPPGVRQAAIKRSGRQGASDKELFKCIWPEGDHKAHWENLVENDGCLCIWKADNEEEASNFESLVAGEKQIFQNMVTTSHCYFKPRSTSMASVLAKEGAVTIADVKIVIQYDNERLNEPRPHYFRFWLDPSDNTWHPYAIIDIPTVDGSYPDILF